MQPFRLNPLVHLFYVYFAHLVALVRLAIWWLTVLLLAAVGWLLGRAALEATKSRRRRTPTGRGHAISTGRTAAKAGRRASEARRRLWGTATVVALLRWLLVLLLRGTSVATLLVLLRRSTAITATLLVLWAALLVMRLLLMLLLLIRLTTA